MVLTRTVHTYEYVRGSSTVLFSAVLAASAKFFRKDSYPMFLGRAQRLLSASLEVGACHIGILQAALILVYCESLIGGDMALKRSRQAANRPIGMDEDWYRYSARVSAGSAYPEQGYGSFSRQGATGVWHDVVFGSSWLTSQNRERTWFCLTGWWQEVEAADNSL